MTTGKSITLTRRTFVGQVMSLLFNMLSRLVIVFLPRNKRLFISWLQSPSAVILEPRKIHPIIFLIVKGLPILESFPLFFALFAIFCFQQCASFYENIRLLPFYYSITISEVLPQINFSWLVKIISHSFYQPFYFITQFYYFFFMTHIVCFWFFYSPLSVMKATGIATISLESKHSTQ